MSTRDAQMNIYLTTIESAVHGRDMRKAIHDGLEKAYNDAWYWYDTTLGNANRALSNSAEALELASSMSGTITTIQNLAEDLEEEYVETRERISNIIAHNNDTEGNTELIDTRTTYQGYTANSAGDAVRLQARQLSQRINAIVSSQATASVQIDTSVSVETAWTSLDPTVSFAAQAISLNDVDPSSIVGIQILYYFETSLASSETNLQGFFMPAPEFVDNKRSSLGTIMTNGTSTYGPYTAIRYVSAEVNSSDYLVITFSGSTVYAPTNPFSITNTDMTIEDPSTDVYIDNEKIIPYEIRVIKNTLNGNISIEKDNEILDARTGVDGTIYNSLGEAIRSQIAMYTAPGIIDALNDDY